MADDGQAGQGLPGQAVDQHPGQAGAHQGREALPAALHDRVGPGGGQGVAHPVVHHVVIDHDVAHDSGCGGIEASGADYVTIASNTVYGNAKLAPNQCSGISVGPMADYDQAAGYRTRIVDNLSYGNVVTVPVDYVRQGVRQSCPASQSDCHTDGNGIIVDSNHRYGYAGRTAVVGNLAFDNGGRGIEVFDSSHVDLVGNTAYHDLTDTHLLNFPLAGGELSVSRASDVGVTNNLAVALDASRAAFFIDAAGDTDWRCNLSFGGVVHVAGSTGPVVVDASNLVDVDPRFVAAATDPAGADFHLRAGSPALAIGAPPGYPVVDIGGTAVGATDRPDLGAYAR